MNIKSFLLSLSVVVLFSGCVQEIFLAIDLAEPAYNDYQVYTADDNKNEIN